MPGNYPMSDTIQVGDWVTVEHHGHSKVARVMALAEGYAMLCYPRCAPFLEQVEDLCHDVGYGGRADPECAERNGKPVDRLQSPEYREGAYPKRWVTYYGTI
jgi:hypothetical protein